ncbi:MAG TPA: hypothetical protein VLT33_40220 [Labilithrix sp.]|nr:hypothetical protein [Labilithrix sp.]
MSDLLRRRRSLLTPAVALLVMTGCGATASVQAAPGTEVDPPPPPVTPVTPPKPADDDHGSVSKTYPAFPPSIAQLVKSPGRVLKSPVVVTVTWNDDPNVAKLESVGDLIGASSYWKDVISEYGVGPVTSGPANHVHLSTPIVLPGGQNADPVQPIVDLITAALGNPAVSGWPEPTDDTLYLVYLHGDNAKKLCNSGAGGLHDSLTVNGKEIPFAIAAACASDDGKSTALDSATVSASHEIGEASVDPFPSTAPAWVGLRKEDLAWELLQMGQDENGDMCEFNPDSEGPYGAPQLTFHVQRQWSNASALAGHAPCVPIPPGEANINVAALEPFDTVTAKLDPQDYPFDPESKGYVIPVGKTRKIPLGLYSDGPTADFQIDAFEGDPFDFEGTPFVPSTRPTLEITLDKNSGQNGQKAYLSVTVNQATPQQVSLVVVRSRLGLVDHVMPILIGTEGKAGKRIAPRHVPASSRPRIRMSSRR